MTRLLMAGAVLALALTTPVMAADTLPTAEDAVIDLVFGECFASVTGATPPAGAIDSKIGGQPVGPGAVRVPTASGMVVVEHEGGACYVHARGLDAVKEATALALAASRSGGRWDKLEDRITRDGNDTSIRTFAYGMATPDNNPKVPVVVIYYPLDAPDRLTAGVTLVAKGAAPNP